MWPWRPPRRGRALEDLCDEIRHLNRSETDVSIRVERGPILRDLLKGLPPRSSAVRTFFLPKRSSEDPNISRLVKSWYTQPKIESCGELRMDISTVIHGH